MPEFRKAYGEPMSKAVYFKEPSRTKQAMKAECDINILLKRYNATGVMPQPWKSPPTPSWGDFAEAPDYFEAQRMLLDAWQAFASLPSKVRNRFANDPGQLLAFVQDPKNREEAQALGLLNPVPPAPPPPAAPPKG